MSSIRLEIVTAERMVFSGDVEMVAAVGVEGALGILPHHAPLMTMLQPGELRFRQNGEEQLMVIAGGFLEVRPDRVIVLADAAEREEEIDLARAEAARERAQKRLGEGPAEADAALAEAALRRALARIKVVQRRRRRTGIQS